MASIREGCFTSVKDKAYVEFAKKLGFPDEEANKLLGSHFKIVTKWLPDGTLSCLTTCDEAPHMDGDDIYEFDKEFDINTSFYGGEAKLFVTAPTEDTFEVVAKTKNLGTWKVFEKYRTEGMDITMTVVETGLSLTEFWPRQK